MGGPPPGPENSKVGLVLLDLKQVAADNERDLFSGTSVDEVG